jgi:hypothetical protein
MNSTVPQSFIDKQMADDPARAEADFLAQFRKDLEGFVSRDAITACIGDFFELVPASGTVYRGFIDAAGGSTGAGDAFAAAIGHRDDKRIVVDCLREFRPPFSPEAVIDELTTLFKKYHVYRIKSDRWAGEFPREAFKKRGITCEVIDKTKSALYVDLLPELNSGSIILPRNERLLHQLISLERRVAHGGHDTIDHPSGQHDDIANCVAGIATLCRKPPYGSGFLNDPSLEADATNQFLTDYTAACP